MDTVLIQFEPCNVRKILAAEVNFSRKNCTIETIMVSCVSKVKNQCKYIESTWGVTQLCYIVHIHFLYKWLKFNQSLWSHFRENCYFAFGPLLGVSLFSWRYHRLSFIQGDVLHVFLFKISSKLSKNCWENLNYISWGPSEGPLFLDQWWMKS